MYTHITNIYACIQYIYLCVYEYIHTCIYLIYIDVYIYSLAL